MSASDGYHKIRCSLGNRLKPLIVLDTGTFCGRCGSRLRQVPRRVHVRVGPMGRKHFLREKRTILIWSHERWAFSVANGC